LVDDKLQRTTSEGTSVIAEKISSVDLTYILEDGSEEGTLTSSLEDVAGIKLKVVGNGFDYSTQSNSKSRGLVRAAMIRNR